MVFKTLLLLITGFIVSIAGGYFMWKYADFFLAKRDYYLNSRYGLLKRKLSMSLSITGLIIFLTIMGVVIISNKNKKQVSKQKIEMKKKRKK
jgi:predicted PurR-regulated permease PerM